MFKRGIFLRKKWNQSNANLHGTSLLTKGFKEILLSGFRGVALTKKIRTDGRVKNILPSATRCVGYNYKSFSSAP